MNKMYLKILIILISFCVHSSVNAESTPKKIQFSVTRFSYQTEIFRLKNISYDEENILKDVDIELVGFKPNNDLEKEIQTALNPYVGIDIYEITVSDNEELIKIINKLPPCPEYPFMGGMSFSLLESIIKYTVNTKNIVLYKALMLKSIATLDSCASEMVTGLFYKLQKNKDLFLKVFSSLNDTQKKNVILATDDFNETDSHLLLDESFINSLDENLKSAAIRYNSLVEELKSSNRPHINN